MKNLAIILFLLLIQLNNTAFASATESVKTALDNKQTADKDLSCSKNCTFVLLNEQTNKFTFINKNRATKRFSPFSTFKVANSLIALDLNVVKNLEQKLTFNQQQYPIKAWWPERWYKTPLTLAKAFKYSAVPIYQQIADEIGHSTMQNYVNRFDYGNKNINENIDSFWLNEALKISAQEQVLFLQKINRHQLSVSPRSYQQLKQIMLVEQSNNYKLYAKTGTGHINKNQVLGWYIGYVENSSGSYYFALNMAAKDFSTINKSRILLVKHYLYEAGIL